MRLPHFPRTTAMLFKDFGDTDERIEKAIRSYELAERAGWSAVTEGIRYQGVLPRRCFDDPPAYADELRAELTATS